MTARGIVFVLSRNLRDQQCGQRALMSPSTIPSYRRFYYSLGNRLPPFCLAKELFESRTRTARSFLFPSGSPQFHLKGSFTAARIDFPNNFWTHDRFASVFRLAFRLLQFISYSLLINFLIIFRDLCLCIFSFILLLIAQEKSIKY